MATISVIICTRNRARYLRSTLRSLARVHIPTGWTAECIVVDNGSTDETQNVITGSEFSQIKVRLVVENRPGKSYAANTALEHAQGDVLLFTDDDVRVPRNWITGMTAPICSGKADAVAGGVVLAPYLERHWQTSTPWLATPLAVTATLDSKSPQRLVGANMAIAQRVFDVVPGFDVQLGPGSALGLGEETLLTEQIRHAGFRITSAFNIVVEHHCNEDRLSRASYLKSAEQIGRSQGYIDYHWKQASVRPVRLTVELAWRYLKLVVARVLRRHDLRSEGLSAWEMVLLTQIYHRRQLLLERGSRRKYVDSKSHSSLPTHERASDNEVRGIEPHASTWRSMHT